MQHTYENLELRAFEMNDVGLGPDNLVCAMLADEMLAELWEQNPYEPPGVYEWELFYSETFKRLNCTAWSLCVQELLHPERKWD